MDNIENGSDTMRDPAVACIGLAYFSPFAAFTVYSCPSDEDRVAVLQNLRRLAAAASEQKATAESPSTGKEASARDGSEAIERKGLETEARGENDEKRREVFPWPLWTDPPFQLLAQQRHRMLQILGMEDADVFGDYGEPSYFTLLLASSSAGTPAP